MTGVLIAFVIAMLVPLYVGTWRTSMFGLALQGAFLSAIALKHGPQLSLDGATTIIDLVGIRTIAAPLGIYLALRKQNAPPRNDVIAPNLFSWAAALVLVVVSFRAADVLVPAEGSDQMLVAVACSAFLLGLLVLSMATTATSQIIGVLRIENAIALFELGGAYHHREPLGIRVGLTAVVLVSIAFLRWYLVELGRDERPRTDREMATL